MPTPTPISTAARHLMALALLLLAFAGLQYAQRQHYIDQGIRQERDRWEEMQRQVERDARATYDENLRLGRRAAAAQLADERQGRLFAERLATERNHATLTLPAPSCTLAISPTPRAQLDLAARAGSPGLTADAVRLWNSALAGVDVPTGACGADGAPDGACAADSGLTVADAWDNQAANALACRIDRGRLTQLQSYLRQAH
ncbi:MAG: hypothetical protein E6Q67_12975 [Roseateles sp.]|nr:MAG: hypothetical protein E6Q67_12975 [Roseateles sp.]